MPGYSVTVESRPDSPAGFTDEQIDAVADLLADHHGSFSADAAGGWGATFSVDADDAHTATVRGLEIARAMAIGAGLPAGDVVRLEAVHEDVLDEELAVPNYPDLVSGPEAASILGVSRQRVHQLATTNSRFPSPLYRLAVGSLWVRAGVEKFAAEWDRRPGRRAGAGQVARVAALPPGTPIGNRSVRSARSGRFVSSKTGGQRVAPAAKRTSNG